ncbi:unnamed protein product [Cylicocyclus nassatus]|uniref:RNase NYN domain-containing protein n=1 Tax=Cylicocyclus nassatus TaxID=53992 RepID=A0AA36GM02_CYLNA|nr:unnamed protein product [Cylicocyclus nassatus]
MGTPKFSYLRSLLRLSDVCDPIKVMCEEACFVKPGPDWLPRLMVVDGCNIGRSACGVGREAVNCAGLMAVIRWLLVRDFDVVAFLPVVYNNSHNFNAVHVHLLGKLEELGLVTFTPARTGRGDRKAFINYDDLYVTTLAARHGGCVLSGDKFKDILAQSTYSEFHHVILHRTLDIKFRFLPHEIVHHGADVFYKALPELFIYEDVSIRAKLIAQKIFASPEDPEYSKVLLRRESWNEERKNERIGAIDDMLAELCERNAIRPLALENLPGYQLQMEPLEELGDGLGNLFEEEHPFSVSISNHGNLTTDELWINSSTSSSNSDTSDEPLIDFSQCTSQLLDLPLICCEDLVSPLHAINETSDQTQLQLTSSDYETAMNHETSECHKKSEKKELLNAYSQEDVLQEIVAHIDTLITTRDKMSKRERSTEVHTNLEEFSSFRDYCERKAMKISHMEAPSNTKNPVKSIEGIDGESGASECDRMSSASTEEEISYNNSHSNEDTRSSCQHVTEESEIESTLSAIFPADIVQQVLTLNASRNVAFLANQCAELCS